MKKDEEEISYATNKKNLQKSKIVFVGDQSVGKTSVITRFIKNTFQNQRNPTIGIDFVSKNVTLGQKMMRLQLWDTAGQQRFRSLIPNYIKDCQAALIIFDITSQQSYENIPKWIDFVKENRGDQALIIVLGNKLDLKEQRQIQHDVAKEKFKNIGINYYELSAKTGQNIQKMFQQLCAQLMNISSESNLPPLQIQQSKVVTSKDPEYKQKPITKQKKQQKQKEVKTNNESTKLTKKNVQQQRRVKQKQCC